MNAAVIIFALCGLLVVLTSARKISGKISPDCFYENGTVIESVPRCQKKYKIFTRPSTWNEAEKSCRSSNMLLASVMNVKDEDTLNQLLIEEGNGEHLWLGATDEAEEGVWKWVDGLKKVEFVNWEMNQPDNMKRGSLTEDCLQIKTSLHWNDDFCEAKNGYICQYYEDNTQ